MWLQVCGAYFELHAVALLFAGRAGLPVDLFLWTEEQMQEERERAATAAQKQLCPPLARLVSGPHMARTPTPCTSPSVHC